jgi:hypothetical protein
MIVHSSGNVGIGTTNPLNILQVASAGRLRISHGTTDHLLLGTLDTDISLNLRIVISYNTRPSFPGNIDYVALSSGPCYDIMNIFIISFAYDIIRLLLYHRFSNLMVL